MLATLRTVHKIGGTAALIRTVVRRLSRAPLPIYQRHTQLFRAKTGLEIGGPSRTFMRGGYLPIYTLASRIDNCNFSSDTVWATSLAAGHTFRFAKHRPPGYQYITEATDLHDLTTESYDFVLSSHTLEHVANPIKALHEWIRVLRPDGSFVMILPHKDGTFDHRRPITSMNHLISDYEKNATEDDLTHVPEILELHDLSRDPGADPDSFRQRSLSNRQTRCLHHHVFDTHLAIALIEHVKLEILDVAACLPCHIFIFAKKAALATSTHNRAFLQRQPNHVLRSPFPSDRAA